MFPFNVARRRVVKFGMLNFLAALLFSAAFPVGADTDPRLYAVEVSASVQSSPAQINLSWPADANATGYTVYRKSISDTSWSSGISLAGNSTTFNDANVSVGSAFEYQIRKTTTIGYTGYGYIYAGIAVPLIENRGTVILMVDNTYASQLTAELGRLQQDLAGDGWTVVRHDVAPTETVPRVKAIIRNDYNANPSSVKTVFLFGHIPVPYSGNFNPDGHPDHQGAWPADVYYGDMDGTWTDSSVSTTSAATSRNWNTPGDGKFDQTSLPADAKLAVGRVDLSNMTCFSNKTPSRSELDLLRQYLNKDHNFRHHITTAQRRGIVCDNFGEYNGQAFASSGWRNFAPMFGAANDTAVAYGNYFPTLSTQSYLWSYGTGGGSFYTCNGVGGSDDFALNDVQSVFMMFFGSYFGDWDNESNFLRAPLGSTTYGLAVAWAGRPHWFFHHMALGETIGYSTRLSQNNNGLYAVAQNPAARQVHIAVLGDPTLRLHPVTSPVALTGTVSGNSVALVWSPSVDNTLQGYHVYRAPSSNGPFTRLTSAPLTSTTFTDNEGSATSTYMVRAIKLETAASGTYYNASQGVFFPANGTSSTTTSTTTTPPTTSAASAASYVGTDATTSGTWKGTYGPDGYTVINNAASNPSYVQMTPSGHTPWTWTDPTTAANALQKAGTSTDRLAAVWYSATSFNLNLNLTDGRTHRVAFYFLDWDAAGRSQTVEISDAGSGTVLNSQTVSGFTGGKYVIWDIKGSVNVKLTRTAGPNAVLSGLFFANALQLSSLPPPTLSNIQMAGSTFQLRVNGNAGQQFVVDATSDMKNWTPISTNTLSGATLDFSDPASAQLKSRFYRARLLP